MISKINYGFSSGAYIVEKTIEVVVKIGGVSETIRIEALRDLKNGRYSTREFIKKNVADVTTQPTYPVAGNEHGGSPHDFSIWVFYDLPWTDGESADEVLSEALSFLEERCNK